MIEELKIPEAAKKIKELEEKWENMKKAGVLLKNEVDEDLVASILSKWTGISVSRMLKSEKEKYSEAGIGYDALNDKYVNMLQTGIVDPTKVTRSALQNAASVASTFLTTEAAVADIPQKEAPAPNPGMGMDGMY